MKKRIIMLITTVLVSGVLLNGCQVKGHHGHPHARAGSVPHPEVPVEADEEETPGKNIAGHVIDLRNIPKLDDIIPELQKARVVYVGEAHTTFGHHLNQLEIIRRLHELDPNIAIGMEFFQQPFQKYLDAYVAGTLEEKEMLRKTEYYSRWGYDYRHYQPILKYAQENGLPLIALNLPKEIIRKVAMNGMDALSEEEKAQIPTEIDDSDEAYRKRIKRVFAIHPHGDKRTFDNFLQVQLLWDEGMAERTAHYLEQNPEKRMVVLAGIGHLEEGTGIPKRVTRRIPMESAVVLPGGTVEVRPGVSDFILFPEEAQLPPKGVMGVRLADKGGALVTSVTPDSPAAKGELKDKDIILFLDDIQISDVADLKIYLLDKKPGDTLKVVVRRKGFFFGDTEIPLEIVLGK